jgi:hypothetical protein
MSLEPDIEEYTSKDTLTCEECGHVNILEVKGISSREKKGHMVYCDEATWLKIKTMSAPYKTIGNFLSFIIKFYELHRERFNVPEP